MLAVTVMHRLAVLIKDDTAIIRRHHGGFDMPKTMVGGKRDDIVEVSNTPIGIAHPQIHIEAMIAIGGMYALFFKRAIEVEHASRPQYAGGAGH